MKEETRLLHRLQVKNKIREIRKNNEKFQTLKASVKSGLRFIPKRSSK